MNNDLIERESVKLADRMLKQSSGDLGMAVKLAYRTVIWAATRPAPNSITRSPISENDPERHEGLAWLLFNLGRVHLREVNDE